MKANVNVLTFVVAILDLCLNELYESGIADEIIRRVKESLFHLFEHYSRLESGARGKVNDTVKATDEFAEQEQDPSLELISRYKKSLMAKDSTEG